MSKEEWEKSLAHVGIVAGCVLSRDGKYLLVQEKQQKAYGLWNLPAGRVDKDESIEDAAVRETKEEVGFDVKLIEKLLVTHESAAKTVKHAFRAEIIGGELVTQEDELLDARWFAYKEIDQLHKEGKLRAEWCWEAISLVEKP